MMRLWAWARLCRLENCVVAGSLVVLGAHLAQPGVFPAGRTLFPGVLAAAAICAFGNIVNDIKDLRIDRIAKPYRPLARGDLPLKTAESFAIVVLGLGIVAAFFLPFGLWVFTLAMAGLALWYSAQLKTVPLVGNAAVAFQSACTVLFGAALAGRISAAVFFASLLIFSSMLTFEVAKDFEDRSGDAAGGIRTIAHHLDWRGRRTLLCCLVGGSTAAVLLPAIAGLPTTSVYALAALPMVPITTFLLTQNKREQEGSIRAAIHVSKAFWVLGIVGIWNLQ